MKIILYFTICIVFSSFVTAALSDNLLSYWSFDTDATDDHGTTDLNVSGATHTTLHPFLGLGAYDFDGSNDYLHNLTLFHDWNQTGEGITISVWINGTSFTSDVDYIIGLVKADLKAQFSLYTQDQEIKFAYNDISTAQHKLECQHIEYKPNYQHILLRFEYGAANAEVWLNGTNLTACNWGDGSGEEPVIAQPRNLLMGSRLGSLAYASGIDEVAIWNRTLSTAEISQLWNNGNGLAYADFDGAAENESFFGGNLNIITEYSEFASISLSSTENTSSNCTNCMHNNLLGLQGGSISEYYHLNSTIYTYLMANLYDFVTSGLLNDTNETERVDALVTDNITLYSMINSIVNESDTNETTRVDALVLENITLYDMIDSIVNESDTNETFRVDALVQENITFYTMFNSLMNLSYTDILQGFGNWTAEDNDSILRVGAGNKTLPDWNNISSIPEGFADGVDNDSANIYVYGENITEVDRLIFAPDYIEDKVPLAHIEDSLFPFGVTIMHVEMTLPEDTTYSLTFEEWSGDPPAYENDIQTLYTNSSMAYNESDNVADADIDSNDYIFIDIGSTNVDWIFVKVVYYAQTS